MKTIIQWGRFAELIGYSPRRKKFSSSTHSENGAAAVRRGRNLIRKIQDSPQTRPCQIKLARFLQVSLFF